MLIAKIQNSWWLSNILNAYYVFKLKLARPKKNYFCKEHFHAQVDVNVASLLFKKSVRYIEIEISSYCNRVCTYCPNAFVDRRSEKNYMNDDVFTSIISTLKRINYNKVIRLHRYNEPLNDREYFLKRMTQVTDAIPNAKFELYTNGDYLNRDYVKTLYALGCQRIHAQAHVNWDTYSPEAGLAHLIKLIKKLGFEYSITQNTENIMECEVHVGDHMLFTYQIRDFMAHDEAGVPLANDRGQSLEIAPQYQRTAPCLRQFEEVSIDYRGKLLPCCHIHSDVPEHKKYVLGEVSKATDLALLWCNQNFSEWRRSMITYDTKTAPCTTCNYKEFGESSLLRQWCGYVTSEFGSRHKI